MITPEEVALSRRLGDVFLHATVEELPPDERPLFVRAFEKPVASTGCRSGTAKDRRAGGSRCRETF